MGLLLLLVLGGRIVQYGFSVRPHTPLGRHAAGASDCDSRGGIYLSVRVPLAVHIASELASSYASTEQPEACARCAPVNKKHPFQVRVGINRSHCGTFFKERPHTHCEWQISPAE
jgi:hypothetical protein